MAERPEKERLTLKLWETPLNLWAYGIYTGDGTLPGSLKAAAGGMGELEVAIEQGLADLERRVMIRDCEHDWKPWNQSPDFDVCAKCGIVKGVSLGA